MSVFSMMSDAGYFFRTYEAGSFDVPREGDDHNICAPVAALTVGDKVVVLWKRTKPHALCGLGCPDSPMHHSIGEYTHAREIPQATMPERPAWWPQGSPWPPGSADNAADRLRMLVREAAEAGPLTPDGSARPTHMRVARDVSLLLIEHIEDRHMDCEFCRLHRDSMLGDGGMPSPSPTPKKPVPA